MALPISQNGRYEITALSFSPSVIALGEETTISVSIRNKTGVNVTQCAINIGENYLSSVLSTSPSASYLRGYVGLGYLFGSENWESAISWPNNTVKTFTGKIRPTLRDGYPLNSSIGYMLPVASAGAVYGTGAVQLGIRANGGASSYYNDEFSELSGANREYLAILSTRDEAQIAFSVDRTSDEAETIKTSIKLTGSTDAFTRSNPSYTVQMHVSDNGTTWQQITLNRTITQLISGVTDDTALISRTFSNGKCWQFRLTLTNGYQTFTSYSDIADSFANVHLSGLPTGGVRFGGFCARSELNKPAFECDYPIYADGGIEGVTNFSTDEVKTGGKWIDGKQIYQKVLRIIPAESKTWYLLGAISNLDTVINIGGMWRLSDGLSFMPLMHYDSYNGTVSWPVIDGNGEVYINFKGSYSPTEIFAIVTYTKTTD